MHQSRQLVAIVLAVAGCGTQPEAVPARPAPPPPPAQAPLAKAPAAPVAAAPVTAAPMAGAVQIPARHWTFEAGVDGWAPWGTTTQGRDELAQVVSRSTEAPHQGGGCLLVRDALATANLYATTEPAIPAAPGQAWLLSAWLRCASADQPRPAVAVAAESSDPARPWLGRVARVEAPASTTWKQVQLAIPALPAGTTRLRLAVFPVSGPDPTMTASVSVDDVRLVPQSLHHLDLGPARNRGLRDETADDGLGGWTDQGDNDLRGLKAGPLTVGGLDFAIGDPDRAAIGLSARRPGFATTASLAVGRTCDRLHLLHTAA